MNTYDDRRPYQIQTATLSLLTKLLERLIQDGQRTDHSASIQLISSNSVLDFKKEFGIPNTMLLPPGLHRGRSYTVSLKAKLQQQESYRTVWELVPSKPDGLSPDLWLHRTPAPTIQALATGLQRLSKYEQTMLPLGESNSSTPPINPKTSLGKAYHKPYDQAIGLSIQLLQLVQLLIDAGQLIDHFAQFSVYSFNKIDSDVTSELLRFYSVSVEASVTLHQQDTVTVVWTLNSRQNDPGHTSLSIHPDYERSTAKLQSAIDRLQTYLITYSADN